MNQKLQAEELMAKYFSGNISTPEKTKLLDWVDSHEDNRRYFDNMLQLWGAVDDYDVDFEPDTEKAWLNVESRLDQQPSLRVEHKEATEKKLNSGRRLLLRIAAAVLFLIIATYWWNTSNNQLITIQTALNENNQFELPDGTQVWLNQNSQISYKKAFRQRNVELTGEAYFDVVRDESNPFSISSGETLTKVLGTSFNVRAYPEDEEIIVTVTSGSVELVAKEDPTQKVVLKVNEEGVFAKTDQQVVKAVIENENSLSWKTKQLGFNDTPMKDVFKAMERYYGVNFEITNDRIWKCEFFGTYQNPELDSLLAAMNFAMGLEFNKEGDTYIVTGGKGCGDN